MSWLRVVMVMSLAAAGCGDNLTIDESAPKARTPGSSATAGGTSVSHSKSFMLVTSVSTGHSQIAKSPNFVSKAGVGGQQ